MSCQLSDLPVEILRIIIEGLIGDDSESAKSPASPEFPGTRRDRLHYHSRDLGSWSCTSSFFQNLLLPYTLEVVELRNNDESGTWLNDLASGEHACLVKEIRFVGSVPDHEESESESKNGNEAFSDTTEILPQSFETVLSNLLLFPSLDSLSIEFTHPLENLPNYEQICGDVETEEQVEAAGEKKAWRALMAKTYQALTQNTEMNPISVTLKHLHIKGVSTFTRQSYLDLLDHLETFRLSLEGGDDTQFEIGESSEYEANASNLSRVLFDHLSHVTSVTMKATEHGPLRKIRTLTTVLTAGSGLFSDLPLALRTDQTPLLKYVHFEYIALYLNMIAFLFAHNTTLEHISLRNCYMCQWDSMPTQRS